MSAKITHFKPRSLKPIKCPICSGKPIKPYSPFCSRRCSQLDLGRWLNEAYVVPTSEVSDESELDSLTLNGDKDAPLN